MDPVEEGDDDDDAAKSAMFPGFLDPPPIPLEYSAALQQAPVVIKSNCGYFDIIDFQQSEAIGVTSPFEDKDSIKALRERLAVQQPYSWNPNKKVWVFPLDSCEALLEWGGVRYGQTKEFHLLVQKRISSAIQKQKDFLQRTAAIGDFLAEAVMQPSNGWKLRDYQIAGIKWLLTPREPGQAFNNGLLADDMGLGKTVQGLMAAKLALQFGGVDRVYIISPASVRSSWESLARSLSVPVEVYSWAKLPKSIDSGSLLIVDEAHYAQDLKSNRTQAVIALADKAVAVWVMTGTPIKNGRPTNLFPLLVAIGHPLARNQRFFEERYCGGHLARLGNRKIWWKDGATNLDELNAALDGWMLRRTKEQCLTELPRKQRIILPVAPTPTYEKEFKRLLKMQPNDSLLVADTSDLYPAEELAADLPLERQQLQITILLRMRQAASLAKVETAIEFAQSILDSGRSVVIFSEFLQTIENMSVRLTAYGVSQLTGSVLGTNRQQLVDDFQSGKNRVFLATRAAGGVGLTLTAASDVILVDRPWTPGDCEQAEDRVYRMGQTAQAVSSYWIQMGDIDKEIDDLLQAKQSNIQTVLRKRIAAAMSGKSS